MKQFFDTLAVFLGKLLKLQPTGWQEAKTEAKLMRVEFDNFKPSKVEVDGEEQDVAPPLTPFAFFGDALLTAVGFVFAVWFVTRIVMAFMVMLPYLLAIAVVALIMSYLANRKPKDEKAQPMAS